MSKVKLAIIGNGMVSNRFIKDLLDKADASQFDITVFCEETRKAYDRAHLSSYFPTILRKSCRWYAKIFTKNMASK